VGILTAPEWQAYQLYSLETLTKIFSPLSISLILPSRRAPFSLHLWRTNFAFNTDIFSNFEDFYRAIVITLVRRFGWLQTGILESTSCTCMSYLGFHLDQMAYCCSRCRLLSLLTGDTTHLQLPPSNNVTYTVVPTRIAFLGSSERAWRRARLGYF
jgi:hypothetical protein